MNKIYIKISELSDFFTKMCYGLTTNKTDIENAVQELMVFFLQMNPITLKDIWEKDGEDGIKRYGAVVLKRSLISNRSPFFYKYKKYYTHINSIYNSSTLTHKEITRSLENLAFEEYEKENSWEKLEYIDKQLDDMYWYDRDVFKLYYYENNTLDSLAKKTKISRNSLFITIDKVRKKLKDSLDD
jgi:hypothetical protein|tara:strand:- start:883 stop:1437 length:555 start_codon:yes stop_codon:yes gene_type:complete